jgi:hypothetical protein
VAATPHKIYLLIDEYDHFANRLLSAGEGTVYEAIVKKTGFVRTFYATLKAGHGRALWGACSSQASRRSCSTTSPAASTSRRTRPWTSA